MSDIVTYTGRVVDPLNLDPGKVNIIDIAHSLANQCRFTGHVREFYSVGQHSVLCAEYAAALGCKKAEVFTVLMHDASETYLSDLARPVKRAPGMGEVYTQVEDAIQATVAEAFNLIYPFPEIVHDIDNALLLAEQQQLMPRFRHIEAQLDYPWDIVPMRSGEAKNPFLDLYARLSGMEPRR